MGLIFCFNNDFKCAKLFFNRYLIRIYRTLFLKQTMNIISMNLHFFNIKRSKKETK